MVAENSSAEAVLDLAVDALDELKAIDLKVLDVRELTSVTDYMVIASGNSDRQVKALADNLVQKAKDGGHRPLGIEGDQAAEWVLVDLVDVVVHVMLPAVRDFYKLEKIWERPEVIEKVATAEDEDE